MPYNSTEFSMDASKKILDGSAERLRASSDDSKMTLEKAPERLTWQLLFVVFSASFGAWFPIGYVYSVTNPIQPIVLDWIREVKCGRLQLGPEVINHTENGSTEALWCRVIPEQEKKHVLEFNSELNNIWAITGTAIALGAFLSLWTTNFWLDRFGSKKTMLYNNCIGLLGALLSGLCVTGNSFEMLIVGRLILGFNVGIAVSVVPLFCTEISPPSLRGAMGTVPGVMLVIGSLVAIVLGLPQIFGTKDLWPIISLLRLIPCLVLFVTIPFCPESPRYLLLRRKDKIAAYKALTWLRDTDNVQVELNNMQLEGEIMADDSQTVSILGIFRDRFLRKVMTICLATIFAQQLSGIGAITMYTTAIFTQARLGKMEAVYGTVGVFVLQAVSVFISVILMDRAGRRVLELGGLFLSTLCSFGILAFSLVARAGHEWAIWTNLACVLTFILVFNIGPAFIPWVLVSEVFTSSARGSAMTVLSAGCHGTLVVCTFLFPILTAAIGDWTFAVFGCSLVVGTIYLFFNLPETKGKDLEQIQMELRQKLA